MADLKPFSGELDAPTLKPFDGVLDSEKTGGVRRIADLGVSALRGAVAVPEAAVGLADIATGGGAGRVAERFGFRPREAKEILSTYYSPEAKAAQRQFQNADGVIDKTVAAVTNPSLIANTVAESLPSMGAGGVVARGALATLPRLGAVAAGAAGEGVVSAGQAAEQIRQETADGSLTGKQAALAAATGAATGALGYAGGAVARRLGVADVDTALATGGRTVATATPKGVARRAAEGAAAEGLLEELPQSISETALQNIALDKPITEGMADQAVLGTLAGATMGAGAGALTRPAAPAAEPVPTKSEAMGIRREDGPLSSAAADAVDSGLSEQLQAAQAQQQAAEEAGKGGEKAGKQASDAPTAGQSEPAVPLQPPQSEAALAPAPLQSEAGVPQPAASGAAPLQTEQQPAGAPAIGRSAADLQVQPETAGAAGAPAPAGPAGQFASYEDAEAYISQQRRAGGARIQALPLPMPGGTFGLATKDTPEYTLAEFAQKQRAQRAAGILDGDILNKAGDPFKNRLAASRTLRDAGPGHFAAPVKGGFVVRKGTPDAQAAEGTVSTSISSAAVVPGAAQAAAAPAVPAASSGVATENGATTQPAAAAVAPGLREATQAESIDADASVAASSPDNDLAEPTDAQKEAGNYRKGHVKLHGLDISVENPRGSTRSGKRPDGSTWSHQMSDHYGYVRRTRGADDEQIDVYVGPRPESQRVFVVDQLDQQSGKFDEHKVMLGYPGRPAALKAYRSNFDAGWKVGPVRSMSVDEFKTWLKEGDTKAPAAAQRLDHGELNIPGRTNGIDAELDRYKAKQTTERKVAAKTAAAQTREDKERARALFAEHGASILAKFESRFGRKDLKAELDSMVKWEPAKFITLAERFVKEQAAASADTQPQEPPAAIARARSKNTFSGQAPGAGRSVGMTQPKGTPVEKLFANFADNVRQNPGGKTVQEQLADFRAAMLKRAGAEPRSFAKDDLLSADLPLADGMVARVESAAKGGTRVQVLDASGKSIAAARIDSNGMLDSIAVDESARGRDVGKQLLAFLDREGLANVDEVPDRSPGFVRIQRAVISGRQPQEQPRADKAPEAQPPAARREAPATDLPDAGQPAGSAAVAGDSEAGKPAGKAVAAPLRSVRGSDQAKAAAKEFVNKPLTNAASRIEARVTGMTLGKMLSKSAVDRSMSPQAHMMAVGNIDHLFPSAALQETRADRDANPNIKALHHFATTMQVDGKNVGVRLMVKESNLADQGSKIYLVQAVEVGTPASVRGDATASEETRLPHPPAGVEAIVSPAKPARRKPKEGAGVAGGDPEVSGQSRRGEAASPPEPSAEGNVPQASKAEKPALKRGDKAVQDLEEPSLEKLIALEGAIKEMAETETAKWANKPKVVVVGHIFDPRLPRDFLDDVEASLQRGEGNLGAAHGVIKNGTVYIVAQSVETVKQARKTLYHEVLGHHGLRGVFGGSIDNVLQQVVNMRRAQVLKMAERYGLDRNDPGELRRAAEEVLAFMAQENPQLGFVKRAVAAIRTWLRENVKGFKSLSYSDAEIVRDFILPARGWVERGRTPERASSASAETAMAFSLPGGANVLNDRPTLKAAALDRLDAVLNTPGKLNWWHKSFGTQYNLAERSPEFKRVFDSVQGFIGDVSRYATAAADLAPKLLPKLETWRDIGKSPISVADNKAISAPIFEGTLVWGRGEDGKPARMDDLTKRAEGMDAGEKAQQMLRSGALSEGVLKMWQGLPIEQFEAMVDTRFEAEMLQPGIVWTDAELRAQFGLTDAQIGLYREFRASTDKSLADLAVSDMLRYAGDDAEGVRQMVLDADDMRAAAVLLRDHLLEQAKEQPDRADVLADTANGIIAKADQAQRLMDRGYAPLSRFGQYTVDVVSPTGDREFFGMFESRLEANRMARKMAGLFPGATIEQGTVSEESYKLFSGVSPETLELFGSMVGLEDNTMFQQYLKLAKTSRSAMKRLIERKGIAGFSEEVGRVLAGFVYSNARQTASNLHMGEMKDAAGAIPKGSGELKDAAVRLVDYVSTPQEEGQAVRGLLFAQYLGGSIASAAVNLTQSVSMTFPYLSQYGGTVKAAGRMRQAVADALKRNTGDAELDAALKAAEARGTVAPQEVHQLMAQAQGKGSLRSGDGSRASNAAAQANNALSRFSLAWGKLFSAAEQFNRRAAFIAGYRTAKAEGIDNPAAFADKVIAETQGIYNKGNKPAWARGAIGGTLFTFKQFGISYVEMLHRLATRNGPEGKRAAALALAMLFLMSGAGGLPFEEDLEDLIDGVMQRLGYSFSTKQARQQFLVDTLGRPGAEFVERGVSGIAGVPIDVSGRLGLGNLIPGTGFLTKKQDYTRDALEIAGPAGDLGKRAFQAVGQLVDADPLKAALTIAPTAARNLAKSYDMATTGMYRDDRGRKVIDTDGYDALAKAIGFQPNDVARVQDATGMQQNLIGQVKLRESEIADRWAIGLFEKDPEKVENAKAMLARWNENNPAAPIRISAAQVYRRVRAMNQSKEERIAKTAPAEVRRAVREELAASR